MKSRWHGVVKASQNETFHKNRTRPTYGRPFVKISLPRLLISRYSASCRPTLPTLQIILLNGSFFSSRAKQINYLPVKASFRLSSDHVKQSPPLKVRDSVRYLSSRANLVNDRDGEKKFLTDTRCSLSNNEKPVSVHTPFSCSFRIPNTKT